VSILGGLRIVELSAFVAVPLGGATLAAMGAEVIRVDPLGGGIDSARLPRFRGRSLYWAGLNQGKRSVALDLGSERGQDLVGRIIATGGDAGGIVITNLPARGWSSYERLRTFRSDLVMVLLQGNPDGSQAVDYTVNARLGFPFVTGPEDGASPVNHLLPAWDAQAGYLVAVAVLAAERHRRLTGEGQLVTLSLMDVGLAFTARLGILAEAELIEEPRRRSGNFVYGTFGRDFTTRDGHIVMVVALTPRQWRAVVDSTAMGSAMAELAASRGADLVDEAARWDARREIAAALEHWVGARTLAEVRSTFDAGGVVWAPYQTFKELVAADPLASPHNPVLARVHDAGAGDYLLPRSPLRFGAAADPEMRPPPRLGEDTEDVLRRVADVAGEEMVALRRAGIIGETLQRAEDR
jgi:2-methylfumaryl-CoA isomerase